MSFAETLTRIVAEKKLEQKERERLAAKWANHEERLLEGVLEAFKKRCTREAEQERTEATVSFAALVREVPEFPTYVVTDGMHLVDSWGDGAAAWWYYAHRGVLQAYVPGTPVQFAELLESMMPKFLERAKDLGFRNCNREQGTWRIVASWAPPEHEPPSKRSRNS